MVLRDMDVIQSTELSSMHSELLECDQLQGDEELSEPCGSDTGEMMTPPQPAPRDSLEQSTSDAEMSFRDLVDDSDEEDRAGYRPQKEKPNATGQVLVDPEDLQVGSCLIIKQHLFRGAKNQCMVSIPKQ